MRNLLSAALVISLSAPLIDICSSTMIVDHVHINVDAIALWVDAIALWVDTIALLVDTIALSHSYIRIKAQADTLALAASLSAFSSFKHSLHTACICLPIVYNERDLISILGALASLQRCQRGVQIVMEAICVTSAARRQRPRTCFSQEHCCCLPHGRMHRRWTEKHSISTMGRGICSGISHGTNAGLLSCLFHNPQSVSRSIFTS